MATATTMININLIGVWLVRLMLCAGAIIAALLSKWVAAVLMAVAFWIAMTELDAD